jgi:ketol-acid reductoisomerase
MMRLTIVGFGNQAKAWSQNLKDSAFPFRVALRGDSPSVKYAIEAGHEVVEIGSQEFYEDQAFALLTPDDAHDEFLRTHANHLQAGSCILYAHGFSLSQHKFHQHYPHLNHILFAPKAIGSELRKQYLIKGKLGAVYSLEHLKVNPEEIKTWLFKLSKSLGINLGPFATSFERETLADLYSEQGLLCSLIPYAAAEMFDNLNRSGIEPELAYFECWHELKLIVNAMVDAGPQAFFDLISPNALIGSEKGFQKLFTPEFKTNLNNLLKEIESGKFNKELEETEYSKLKAVIKKRWLEAPLTKTFNQMNLQDTK